MVLPLLIAEINTLALANQGLAVSLEHPWVASWSVGLGAEFDSQKPYEKNGITARRQILMLSPFARWHPFSDTYDAVFIGGRVVLARSLARIGNSAVSYDQDRSYVAPCLEAGYRFVLGPSMTLSAYAGAGIKSVSGRFAIGGLPTDQPDWSFAASKMNDGVSSLQPSYGLALGRSF